MTTKTFELTIDERELMCRMLRYCMENNADCNVEYSVGGTPVWNSMTDKQDQEDMKALHDKLEVITTRKEGWVLKDQLISIWHSTPDEDIEMFQRITWEEHE